MERGTVRALFAMLVAVVFGSAAVVSLFQVITSYQAQLEQAAKPEDQVMVVVAARDLYPGVTIEAGDLVEMPIAPRFLPAGAYLTTHYVVGQRPRDRILAQDIVRSDRLANPDTGQGMNALIPNAMRAVSVEIADGAALSGQLNPGSYVDVVWTTDSEEVPGEIETHTILQAMFVLAVNDRTTRGRETVGAGAGRSTVTLLSTPREAMGLTLAEVGGDLQFTLRNDLDIDTFVDLKGVAMNKRKEVKDLSKYYDRQRKKRAPVERIVIKDPEEVVLIIKKDQVDTISFPAETDAP